MKLLRVAPQTTQNIYHLKQYYKSKISINVHYATSQSVEKMFTHFIPNNHPGSSNELLTQFTITTKYELLKVYMLKCHNIL